jgi:hypothetical protein
MVSSAEKAWAEHLAKHTQVTSQPRTLEWRPGDWQCKKCFPKVHVFASKDHCFKCGSPRDAPPEPEPVSIQFGVRGDSLLQCKHEGGSKYAKKWRNFKADFENELYNAFGNVDVDYTLSIEDGGRIKDVIKTVAEGAKYDIMIIGIIVQDLLVQDSYTGAWSVIPEYPESLDSDLELLAATILSKSNGSMVLAGGPASFWGFAPKWDNFLAHVRNKLRSSGLQVVPVELADPVFAQMSKESKGFYFANNDEQKEMFVKQWAAWLIAGSSTPELFRTLTVETALPSERDRSRSPRRQPAQQFGIL